MLCLGGGPLPLSAHVYYSITTKVYVLMIWRFLLTFINTETNILHNNKQQDLVEKYKNTV